MIFCFFQDVSNQVCYFAHFWEDFRKRRNTEQNKQGEEKKKIVLGDLQKN
jgi:uncharacterized protein (DUF2225 family)